ncbi:MAG: hypothetical protein ACFCU4_04560 [Puniceicoccaceae bacterium]
MKKEAENQGFPWWAIPLIALASFRFEYHSENGSSFFYDGTGTAILVIGIISLVMVFGVTKRVQRVLKSHNLIERIPRSRFWVLLPFSIILPAIGYRALSGAGFIDDVSDKHVHHWDFQWGASPLHIWLVVGTLAIIFLHTTILTLTEIERKANNS